MSTIPAIALIPARYGSTRLPGKPLIQLGGQTMIRRVFEKVENSGLFSQVWVATDHPDIAAEVQSFGGRVHMTSPDWPSGTDRCAEAMRLGNFPEEIVVNVQGDEPFVSVEALKQLVQIMQDPAVDIATLAIPIAESEKVFNPNVVKVVTDRSGRALYFSRSPIPYVRGVGESEWIRQAGFLKHLGLYAYRSRVLQEVARLQPGKLEKAESLEQLRWLEAGYRLVVGITDQESPGIDTPDDVRMAEVWLKRIS